MTSLTGGSIINDYPHWLQNNMGGYFASTAVVNEITSFTLSTPVVSLRHPEKCLIITAAVSYSQGPTPYIIPVNTQFQCQKSNPSLY